MKVLLCRPQYFDVPEFDPQNKHMNPNVRPDLVRALKQHEKLADLYHHLGLDVYFARPVPKLVDMTFTANLGFISGRKVLLSNFTPARRREESEHFGSFLRKLGYLPYTMPQGIFFEGAGDAIPFKGKILCGYGFRTSPVALAYLAALMEKEVVPLELCDLGARKRILYHLDTAGIFMEDIETVIAYPGAFTRKSLKRLEKIANVIPASYADANNLALNAVVIPKTEIWGQFDKVPNNSASTALMALGLWPELRGVVVTSALASRELRDKIERCKYFPVTVELDEFLKSGGGAFCLTKIL
jgi:N-dimethylarginine dimethylaminohydrolase